MKHATKNPNVEALKQRMNTLLQGGGLTPMHALLAVLVMAVGVFVLTLATLALLVIALVGGQPPKLRREPGALPPVGDVF